jgi:8-oxo-dGTP pyrophosphatase MutT (NUDIX family)/GNAT superfamily N-acetyltransferase
MDGLTALHAFSPVFNAKLYTQGNAFGWLAKGGKTASAEYQLAGRLYAAKSGWLLLSVPNALVRGVFDAITAPGVELPLAGAMNVPNVDKDLLNAHISVMTAAEVEKIGADNITERGQSFSYTLGSVREVSAKNIDGVSKLWLIEVASPGLSALRKSYGLSALPKDQPFHITVAIRRTKVLGNNSVSKGYETYAEPTDGHSFRNPLSRGELKAASSDTTTYDCGCSGPCMCPDTCVCKKNGYCGHNKQAEELPWRERVEVYTRHPQTGKIYGGVWDSDKSFAVPGGGIDPGETPEQAAIRELAEETGIKATNPVRLPIAPVDHPWSDKTRAEKAKVGRGNFAGSRTHFVMVDFLNKLRGKKLDHWGATNRRFYSPNKALALMAGKQFMAPPVAAGRVAALNHILSQAAQKQAKAAAAETRWINFQAVGQRPHGKDMTYQLQHDPENALYAHVLTDKNNARVAEIVLRALPQVAPNGSGTLFGVNGFHTNPKYRRKGYGRALWDEVANVHQNSFFLARPDNYKDAELTNDELKQVYARLGFSPTHHLLPRLMPDVLVRGGSRVPIKPESTGAGEKSAALPRPGSKLSRAGQKDLLPGGKADNVPDREVFQKALAEGAKHEHEHTSNDQIAGKIAKDHLQEDAADYKKIEKIEKAAAPEVPSIILRLREAKAHSDNKRYDRKNAILQMLMSEHPADWYVDDPLPKHMGVTHAPTNFRFHADPAIIPVGVKVRAKAAKTNPYAAQLAATPVQINRNDGLWQNFMHHLRKVKQRGDWQLQAEQNSQGLLAELNPAYKQQLQTALARGQYPQHSTTTQVIQRHGDNILSYLGK